MPSGGFVRLCRAGSGGPGFVDDGMERSDGGLGSRRAAGLSGLSDLSLKTDCRAMAMVVEVVRELGSSVAVKQRP
jgi:hypothetical protein